MQDFTSSSGGEYSEVALFAYKPPFPLAAHSEILGTHKHTYIMSFVLLTMKNRVLLLREVAWSEIIIMLVQGENGGGACCRIDTRQNDYTKSVGPPETPRGWSCRTTRERKPPFLAEVLGNWRLFGHGDFPPLKSKLKRKASWSPRIFKCFTAMYIVPSSGLQITVRWGIQKIQHL